MKHILTFIMLVFLACGGWHLGAICAEEVLPMPEEADVFSGENSGEETAEASAGTPDEIAPLASAARPVKAMNPFSNLTACAVTTCNAPHTEFPQEFFQSASAQKESSAPISAPESPDWSVDSAGLLAPVLAKYSPALTLISEAFKFPADGDLQTSDLYERDGTYIEGQRFVQKVSSITRLDWEIVAQSNTLKGDTQDSWVYLNGKQIGGISLKENDQKRTVSFSFAPIDVSQGLTFKVMTIRSVKANCGSFKFAFNTSNLTAYQSVDTTNPDAVTVRKTIFPQLSDYQSSDQYGREGTYYESKRFPLDLPTISSIAWDIYIAKNTLVDDTQDQALYINDQLVGNFSFTKNDSFFKQVSFRFLPVAVTNEFNIRLVTTRTTRSGAVTIALGQSLFTVISDGGAYTAPPTGLRMRSNKPEVAPGEAFDLEVSYIPPLSGNLAIGKLADAYLAISPSDESWTVFLKFDPLGKPLLSGIPEPLVKDWPIVSFDYVKLSEISVPADLNLVGSYNITAFIVPPGTSVENSAGLTIVVGVKSPDAPTSDPTATTTPIK